MHDRRRHLTDIETEAGTAMLATGAAQGAAAE
jgi:hypothetical protein